MKEKRKIGRGVCIVGAGMSKFGMFKDKDSKNLFVEAFNECVASVDKGIDPKDIEAMWLGNFTNDFFVHQGHWGPIISDAVGLTPTAATRTEGACAASTLAFRDAVFAIASGFYDIVIAGGVAANSRLREKMEERSKKEGIRFYVPKPSLCTDNAAMVASYGYFLFSKQKHNKNFIFMNPFSR